MEIDLSGRTAFISGSTQGIGLAIAAGLAGAGASVWINGRDEEKVRERRVVARRLGHRRRRRHRARAPGGSSTRVPRRRHPGQQPRHLRSAAACSRSTTTTWQRYWDVNVMSAIRLTRHYLPGMTDRGWGRAQFMASDSAVVIPEEMVHYGVTKTALLGVSRGFAKVVRARA